MHNHINTFALLTDDVRQAPFAPQVDFGHLPACFSDPPFDLFEKLFEGVLIQFRVDDEDEFIRS